MAFDFPSDPTGGQVFTPAVGGPSWTWNGTEWVSLPGDSPPEPIQDGKIYGRQNHVWTEVPAKAQYDAEVPLKAPLASPVFTGDPRAPTPSPGDNDTSIATTAYTTAAIAAAVTGGGGFPEAPLDGKVYGRKSAAWDDLSDNFAPFGSAGGASTGDLPPASPQPGELFYETDTGLLYVWYVDPGGAPGQWVQTGGTNAASGTLASTGADMSIGFRQTGNRFVVNDAAGLDGTDVVTVTEAGQLTAKTFVEAAGGAFFGNATETVLGSPPGVNGQVLLRPNGMNNSSNQIAINTSGYLILGSASALAVGTVSTGGASAGTQITAGLIQTSKNVTTAQSHLAFYNPNGTVGSITTNASATTFNTTSDERLKEGDAEYDPDEAIAIIRADPVLAFTWKATGQQAVGWFAQRSHSIREELATPPQDDDPDGVWGIDYGRRTPYLWAALSRALDRIDALEARLAILEPK